MTREEAEKNFRALDGQSRQCPGGHLEFGGFYAMWNLEDALHRAYDHGQGVETIDVPTDREYVEGLLAEGKDIFDGGTNGVQGLSLKSIHAVKGLKHVSGGTFATTSHMYLRCDSLMGARFYERVPR
jgi:hypothetical protein